MGDGGVEITTSRHSFTVKAVARFPFEPLMVLVNQLNSAADFRRKDHH